MTPLTSESCLYLCEYIKHILENKNDYCHNKRQSSNSWFNLYDNNELVLSIWNEPRKYTMNTSIDLESCDIVSEHFWIFKTSIFGDLLNLDSTDDIDALAMQYSVMYNSELEYNLVLASFVYQQMKIHDYQSIAVLYKNILLNRSLE